MAATPNVAAMATLRRPAPPTSNGTTSSSASTLNAMLDKSSTSTSTSLSSSSSLSRQQPPAPPTAAKPRLARPGKPLPGLPPTPVSPAAAVAAPAAASSTPDPSTPRQEQGPQPGGDAATSTPAPLASASSEPPVSEAAAPVPAPAADADASAATETESSGDGAAAGGAAPSSPSPLARPPALIAKKPPVPSRRPGSQIVSSSPAAPSSPTTAPHSPLASSSSSASMPTSASENTSPSTPSLKLTPSSPSSSGDTIPTSAAVNHQQQMLTSADSPRASAMAGADVSKSAAAEQACQSPRRTSGGGGGSGGSGPSFIPGLGSSSLLSVFSSSSAGATVDDLEKRLRKVKEKREKLVKELKRLDDEEKELEEKLKEALEDGGSGRKKGSRRGSQIVRVDNSNTNGAATPSLGSASSLTLASPGGAAAGSSASAAGSLASAGSGISGAGGTLHRRMGSLVGMTKGPKKKKKGSTLTLFNDKDKEQREKADAGSPGPPSGGSSASDHDINAPRQFYCNRAGSVTFKVEKNWDVASAPPVKKYAREVRRKKTMLYIDSTSIQVMVPEEKTAKFPLADIKHVGYSVKQFYMVAGKPRRKNVEMFEFKTKEGQDIFEWVVALKNEEKRQKEKEKEKEKAKDADAESQATPQSQPADGSEQKPDVDSSAATSEAQQAEVPTPESVSQTQPTAAAQAPASDRAELVRWSVAFIAPIVLDNDTQDADDDDDEDPDEDSSGSSIILGRGESEEDAGEFTISSPPSVPKSPSPAKKVDIHRETLLELLATERNYNADLDLVVEVWMAKLKESRMVEPADMSAIFSNIEQIRNLNKVLFNSLEGLDTLPMESLNVGERFQTFIAYLKLYTQYCSNYEIAHSRLVSLKEAKWELPPFLESIQSRKECKNLDLESYLIKPMQRLTKYPLLIQALLRHTPPTHPDYDNLARCYDGVQKVVLTVNENKRKNENLTKLVQIQQQFLEPGLKLVEATRKFLREGTFPRVVLGTTIIKNCTVLLFNDIVVLAVKKKNKYQAKSGKITLRGSYVWEDRAVKFGFTLVGREAADKITVEAATEQEKTMWMDEVSQALVQLPHNSLIGGSSSPATAEKFVRSEGGKE